MNLDHERAGDVAACREVFVSCAVAWHSWWPGLRIRASVLPTPTGAPRGVRKQALRFGQREHLTFDVFPGEILEFRLDAIVGVVADLSGPTAVTVPPEAAGRALEISLRKAGFVIAYGPFTTSISVRD